MAIELKLFERVESGKGLFAVESISLIYNAFVSPDGSSRDDVAGASGHCGPDVRTDIFVSGIPLSFDGFYPYGRANVIVGILVSGYV